MKIFLSVFPWVIMPLLFLSFGLQALKVFRTKKTSGLSLVTFFQTVGSTCAWLINALIAGPEAYPIGLANGISMLFIFVIIFYILKNKSKGFAHIYIFLISIIFSVSLITLLTINYATAKDWVHIKDGVHITDKNSIGGIIDNKNDINSTVKIIVPIIAGLISSSAFIPQLVKVIKTKNTANLSYFLLILYILAVLLSAVYWVAWGIYKNEWSQAIPSIIFTATPGFIQIWVAWLKIKDEFFKKNKINKLENI